jgi:bifunctional non-homologous end joining protein LigD
LDQAISAHRRSCAAQPEFKFVIDGEAVLLGVDGVSDFDGLHSRKHDDEIEFYAFDCLVSDGDDLRKLPLSTQDQSGAAIVKGSTVSIRAIGPDVGAIFAILMGAFVVLFH